MALKKMRPAMILKTYFGLKEGETLTQFAAELRALTEEDREFLLAEACKELGVEVETAP